MRQPEAILRTHQPAGTPSHRKEPVMTQAIGDHALLSDRHSAALVSSGRVGRLAVLAALRQPLDLRRDPRRRRRALVDPARRRVPACERDYVAGSMVLRTRFAHRDGHPGAARRPGPRGHPRPTRARRARPAPAGPDLRPAPEAASSVDMSFPARPEYGLVIPVRHARRRRGRGRVGGADRLTLSCTVASRRGPGRGRRPLRASAGQSACFGLEHAALGARRRSRAPGRRSRPPSTRR